MALRVALTFHLVADGVMQVAAGFDDSGSIAAVVLGVVQVLCGGAVLAGFLTAIVQPVVGAMTLGIIGYQVVAAGARLPLESWQSFLCVLVLPMSLAMLGPGAYSVDARLFGRQEIVFGPRPSIRN